MTYATLVKNLCKMKIIRDDFTSIEEQSSQVIMTESHQVTDFSIDTKVQSATCSFSTHKDIFFKVQRV